MANDPVLFMLSLARRAGKLAWGDEMTREACAAKSARCVFLAGDAGAATVKKARAYAERAGIPCVALPQEKAALGAAIGKAGCAVCAVTDIGMANAAVQKLAAADPAYAAQAAALGEKNARIQSRRGLKKKKNRAEAPAQPAAQKRPAHKAADGSPRGAERPRRASGTGASRKPSGPRPAHKAADAGPRGAERPRKPSGAGASRKPSGPRPVRKTADGKTPRRQGGRPRIAHEKPHRT